MIIRSGIDVAKPRDEVWAFFVDHELMARIFHEAFEFQFVSTQRAGVGTEWIQRAQEMGDPVEGRHKVIAIEPPARLVITSDDSDSHEVFTFQFSEVGHGTRVDFELAVKPIGLFKSIFVWLFKGAVKGFMDDDLKRMRAYLEDASA